MKCFNINLKLKIIILVITYISSIKGVKEPEYESPIIVKNQNNLLIDNKITNSFTSKFQNNQDKIKEKAINDIIRNFSTNTVDKLIETFEQENINERSFEDIVSNSDILLGKSIKLQKYVNYLSDQIIKKLTLLDTKIKQITIIDEAINSFSNNDIFKTNKKLQTENLNKINSLLLSTNSLYNLNFNRIYKLLDTKTNNENLKDNNNIEEIDNNVSETSNIEEEKESKDNNDYNHSDDKDDNDNKYDKDDNDSELEEKNIIDVNKDFKKVLSNKKRKIKDIIDDFFDDKTKENEFQDNTLNSLIKTNTFETLPNNLKLFFNTNKRINKKLRKKSKKHMI